MNTPNYLKAIALFVALIPSISFGQLSAETTADFSEPERISVEPSNSTEKDYHAKVLEVKKMTRYSLGFVVDLPTVSDVLTYMSQNLGVDTQEADAANDPNWISTTCTTRNFEVIQNENGAFEVKVRFYPPADPMNAEVVGIQKKSRIMCSEAFQQLKADIK